MLRFGALMLAMAVIGCGDSSTVDPAPPGPQPPVPDGNRNPEVKVEVAAHDHTTATFLVTPADADWCAIAVFDRKPETEPTAEQIRTAEKHAELDADKASYHSVIDLAAESTYWVYAAAGATNRDGKEFYDVAVAEFTTDKAPAMQLLYQSPNTLWYDGVGHDGSDNYYIGLCETEIVKRNDDWVPDTEGKYILYLDIYGANTTDTRHPVLPEGTYTLGEEKVAGTLNSKYSGAVDYVGQPIQLTAGEVKVARTEDTYTINLLYTLTDGTVIEAVYVGGLDFEIGHVAPKVPKIDHDVTTTFVGVKAAYVSKDQSLTGYNDQIDINIYDAEPNEENLQTDGYLLTCQFVMPDVDRYNIVFPSNTYTVSLDYQPYTTPVGDVIALSDSGIHQIGTTVRHINAATGEVKYAAIVSGSVTFNTEDNFETYTVDVEMTTAEGFAFKGTYNGPIDVEGELPPRGDWESPLYEDKVLDLGDDPKMTIKYRSYSKIFQIDGIAKGESGTNVEGFRIEINAKEMDNTVIPTGTFRAGTESGDFALGTVDRIDGVSFDGSFGYIDYFYEFWYIDFHTPEAFAPATDGTVTITKNDDGTYTIDYELYDDAQPRNKITCNITCNLTLEQD